VAIEVNKLVTNKLDYQIMENINEKEKARHALYTILPADWRGLSDTPPDELVEVIDSKGNKALAYPTWYPFKVVSNSNKIGKWTSDIVPCKPYWDGGWLIECVGLSKSIETVVGWKPICA
jgi:hypothetical protein